MMRLSQISSFILGLAFPLSMAAQPFPVESGAAWRGVVYGLAGPIPFAEIMCGDTTINTVKYSKIYQLNYGFNGEFYNSFYHACTRVAGQKVWVIAAGGTEETLLYDFDVEAGDTLHLQVVGDDWEIGYYVENIEQISIDGALHKKITFQTSYGIPDIWIEGIGSIMGPLGRGFFVIDAQPALTCFLKDGEVVYKVEDAQTCEGGLACDLVSSGRDVTSFTEANIFPNPADDAVWINTGKNDDFVVGIFSAAGQLLTETIFTGGATVRLSTADLPAGFYFFKLVEKERPASYRYFKITISR